MKAIQKENLMDSIEQKEDELTGLITELIKQKPVTGNEKPAQEVVIRKLKSMGLEPDVWEPNPGKLREHPAYFETTSYKENGYENRPNVVALKEGEGNGPSLTLCGHIDVVPVDEDEWTYDPWDPVIDNGRLYGRGSYDMLCGIAAILIAYDSINELDIELAGDLMIQTTIEEETGGIGGALSALERGYQPDAAISGEPWELPDIGMASGGTMNFQITVPGESAHAAFGYEGVNAIGKAFKIHEALDKLDQERKKRISYEPACQKTKDMCGHETNINLGIIEGGNWSATLASEAFMKYRVGWPPGETGEEVKKEIKSEIQSVIDNDEWLSNNPPTLEWVGLDTQPHELDTNEKIVQLAKKNAEGVTGEKTSFSGGWSTLDERFFNLYYDIPCPSLGGRGGPAHGPDESVEVESVVQTVKTLALTTLDWCGTHN